MSIRSTYPPSTTSPLGIGSETNPQDAAKEYQRAQLVAEEGAGLGPRWPRIDAGEVASMPRSGEVFAVPLGETQCVSGGSGAGGDVGQGVAVGYGRLDGAIPPPRPSMLDLAAQLAKTDAPVSAQGQASTAAMEQIRQEQQARAAWESGAAIGAAIGANRAMSSFEESDQVERTRRLHEELVMLALEVSRLRLLLSHSHAPDGSVQVPYAHVDLRMGEVPWRLR